MSVNDGGPAFPALDVEHFPAGYGHKEHDEVRGISGMSLRDYFAGQALALGGEFFVNAQPWPSGIAMTAYDIADAMLRAREAKS